MNAWIIPGLKYREPKKLDSDLIIESVCGYFGVTHEVLKKKNRLRERVIARHLICYFLRKYTNTTLFDVGQLIGGRDHTTVIHGVRTVTDFLHIKDGEFLKMVFDIETIFTNKQKQATDNYLFNHN